MRYCFRKNPFFVSQVEWVSEIIAINTNCSSLKISCVNPMTKPQIHLGNNVILSTIISLVEVSFIRQKNDVFGCLIIKSNALSRPRMCTITWCVIVDKGKSAVYSFVLMLTNLTCNVVIQNQENNSATTDCKLHAFIVSVLINYW